MPDATYGAVKALSFADVEATDTKALVTTTLHLEQNLGSAYIKQFGGLHKFFNWQKPIVTDSGGFQVFSLIHAKANPANKISEAGCSFIDYHNGNYHFLSPETSQVIQHNLGSDIRVVLDEPTPVEATAAMELAAVDRTTRWAKRSKQKFLELLGISDNEFNNPQLVRPLLCCVVQGGNNFELRKRSAEQLMEIGFDIYGFGGAPMLKQVSWKDDPRSNKFYEELLAFVAEILPRDKVKYALGVGTPDDLKFCIETGWDLFDTVLPSRNARHGTLYVSPGQGDQSANNYDLVHIRTARYQFDEAPIDANCSCECCHTVSRAYLRHLIRINEAAGFRLASIHNLTFFQKIVSTYKN
jgi:queuine tRNA-ribosyltransferase